MGISVQIKGASFTNFIDQQLPYAELAKGFWLFGGNGASTANNLAPNADVPTATIVGAPVYGAGYAELTADDYLDTGVVIDTSAAFTMISVASIATNIRQPLCGNWHSGINDTMLDRSPDLRFATRGSGSGVAPIVNADYNKSMFHAGVKGAGVSTMYLKTAAGMQVSTGTPGFNVVAPNNYRIGPTGGLGLQTSADVQRHSANLLFDVALTEQQIEEIYAYLAYQLPKRGVVLL